MTPTVPTAGPPPVVVAIVPAKDRADSVGATVRALVALPQVDRVVVVDDGSSDDTTGEARRSGADVVRLHRNRGKGGAVRAGVEASPEADVHLLIDADLARTAAAAHLLLDPVLSGEADMTIGVLPPAGGRAGFGKVKDLAGAGIRRASGFRPRAPLSGQRAVRSQYLRELRSAERFGLETALSIDVARAGGRILEVDVPMDHRHTGRSVAGFLHRARQGADIVRALWPRLVGPRARAGLIAGATTVLLALMVLVSGAVIPTSEAMSRQPERVVVFGIPRWSLEDVRSGVTPTLDALGREGALASMSVRTLSGRPSSVEAYASIGAGTRVAASTIPAQAFPADTPLERATAATVTFRRTGVRPSGEVVVPSIGATIEMAGPDLSSAPGALGDALEEADVTTAVVGTADRIDTDGLRVRDRPTAMLPVTSFGSVDLGDVDSRGLLEVDERSPYGLRADHDALLEQVERVVGAGARLVVVDPGDTDRAVAYAVNTDELRGEQLRRRAMVRTDRLVRRLVEELPDGTLFLFVGLTPPSDRWELTPIVAHGPGVTSGYLHSTSTKRLGLVTLTDLSPTILEALDVPVPDGMIGAPLRVRAGNVDEQALLAANDAATGREGIYFPITLTFIIVQALLYLLTILVLSQGPPQRGIEHLLRFAVLTFAAWPLASFVLRMFPTTYDLGAGAHALLWLVSAGIAALVRRSRRHPLSPLGWLCGLTAALLLADVATGARLQMSSFLGYSPHTAARFTGYGNTAFAVLAATAVVAAAIHIHYAPRRRDAWLTAAGFLVIVVVADGAPTLGSDVGGILTLVPVFGLVLYVTSGKKLDARSLLVAALVTTAVVTVVALLDYSRGPGERTHLGDFVGSIINGDGTFRVTIARKWATNLRVFQRTIWTWMVPIMAVFMVYVLVIAKGWRRLLPMGSALRAGLLGTVVAGLLGWLVNDSGVVVTALVFVYVGPYVLLLALDADADGPELLPAAPEPLGDHGAGAGDTAGAPAAEPDAPVGGTATPVSAR